MTRTYERLLITGAEGALGRVLRESAGGVAARVRVTDLAAPAPWPGEEVLTGDLADEGFAREAMSDVDAVVHLAAVASERGFAEIVRSNIVALHNVFAAAQAAGVRRIVWASSNHAIGFYPTRDTIDDKAPPRPDSLYGASKVFGEALAQFFWDRHQLESVSLRIGSCVERPTNRRMLATWLSYPDFLRLIGAGLTAPAVGHTIVYGVSDNDARFWDNSGAAHIGYRPQDNAESFREAIEREQGAEDPDGTLLSYHGGDFMITGR